MNVKGRETFVNRLVLLSFDDEMVDVVSDRKRGKKICF